MSIDALTFKTEAQLSELYRARPTQAIECREVYLMVHHLSTHSHSRPKAQTRIRCDGFCRFSSP
jgi:hypothetical protein